MKNKNIHVLPTDKPSRLHFDHTGLFLSKNYQLSTEINSIIKGKNIYITSNEEIKEGEWCMYLGLSMTSFKVIEIEGDKLFYGSRECFNESLCKKIILTTDQYLIKDGVQEIPDEFLEWFVKNPSCEWVEVKSEILYEHKDTYRPYPSECKNLSKTKVNYYLSIIPKEEPKQETLEEVAERLYSGVYRQFERMLFIKGAKWQQERMYSEEEVHKIVESYQNNVENSPPTSLMTNGLNNLKRNNMEDKIKKDTHSQSPEYDLVQHIKFCLECNNLAQAIRLIEKYGHNRTLDYYNASEVLHLMTLAFEQGFKKADTVEAGLEAKETDTEVNWIFLKHKK